MKTKVLLFVVALIAGWNIHAQDTLNQCELKNGYRAPEWFSKDDTLITGWSGMRVDADIQLVTHIDAGSDTLWVAGIATAAMTQKDYFEMVGFTDVFSYYRYFDTSFNNTLEYLRMYKTCNVADSMVQYGEDLPVHFGVDTVAYYIDHHFRTDVGDSTDVFGIIERYYSSPVMMTDDFYVGVTNYKMGRKPFDTLGVHYDGFTWSLSMPFFYQYRTANRSRHKRMHHYPSPHPWPDPDTMGVIRNLSWHSAESWEVYYIFPILAVDTTITPGDTTIVPGGDTIVPGGDTLAVHHLGQLSRYVTVSSNPAVDRATVLSSFGLLRIEAYDPSGRRILDSKATGLRSTLDVAAWPRGTYLLRIHTPAGLAVKKLIIQ